MNTVQVFIIFCSVFLCVFLSHSNYALPHDAFGIRDTDHMKDHLSGIIDFGNLTDSEHLFYFFEAHDLDVNYKLDGCELLKSLLHTSSEDGERHSVPVTVDSAPDLVVMVDTVLDGEDKNLDGFIDYSEFLSGQLRFLLFGS